MSKEAINGVQLEAKFRDLEAELVNKIRKSYAEEIKEGSTPVFEIAADNDNSLILFLDSDGEWSLEHQMIKVNMETMQYEDSTVDALVGTKPPLSSLLCGYLLVDDMDFRCMDSLAKSRYIENYKEGITLKLMEDMQIALQEI
jgi:hypothetical protein